MKILIPGLMLWVCAFHGLAQNGSYFLTHHSPSEENFDNVCFDMTQDDHDAHVAMGQIRQNYDWRPRQAESAEPALSDSRLLPSMFHRRVALLLALCALVFALLAAQMGRLTLLQGPELRAQAEKSDPEAGYRPTGYMQGWFNAMVWTEVIKRTLDAGKELTGELKEACKRYFAKRASNGVILEDKDAFFID